MPRPESLSDVLKLVRTSGVVPEERLTRFLDLLQESGLETTHAGGAVAVAPGGILSLMVEQGLLTRYQAAEIGAGRNGFFLAGFRLLDLLGRGGMGHVYLAEHELLGKRIALKVLVNGGRSDEAACERFVREARAAAALDHPNIVRVFDVNVRHDPPYLVMEYVDGVSLQAAVARHGTFTAGEAAAVAIEIARGLQCIADSGLVHRDIKPANLLLERTGCVKILDLGIARFQTDPISVLHDPQSVVGTLDYLAPEQAIDSCRVDIRADLYALGATLFFLLAGHPPFADDESERKIVRKRESNPPSVAAFRLDIPTGLAEVINKLLSRSASERYRSPSELIEALEKWASPGEEFPDRFFRTWRGTSDAPGRPTAAGESDPRPTPLPPTRRILRSQTERRIAPLESVPDTTPMPVGSLRSLPATALAEADGPPTTSSILDESGSPTVTLTRAKPVPRTGRRVVMWALLFGAVLAALLLRMIAAGWR
jgi:serine/threonine-protein kinase